MLQSLREPIERGIVQIARSGCHYWFPARFQLIMSTNPCPCGKLGQPDSLCMCSPLELHQYWKKLGAALCDRIDIRVPTAATHSIHAAEFPGLTTAQMMRMTAQAITQQHDRCGVRNADLGPDKIERFCQPDPAGWAVLEKAVEQLGLSHRAQHSTMKISRTIADLEGCERICKDHVMEAVQYRRYGEGDYYWRAA
ncbi:MAG: ATP-binding protein, partial [Spirochaetota bacterium]